MVILSYFICFLDFLFFTKKLNKNLKWYSHYIKILYRNQIKVNITWRRLGFLVYEQKIQSYLVFEQKFRLPSFFKKKKKIPSSLFLNKDFVFFFLNFWWKYVHASLYFFFSVFLIKVDGIGEATSPINLNQHVPLLMEIEKVKNQEKTIPTTCSLVFTYFKRSETKTSTKSNNNVVHFFSSRFG